MILPDPGSFSTPLFKYMSRYILVIIQINKRAPIVLNQVNVDNRIVWEFHKSLLPYSALSNNTRTEIISKANADGTSAAVVLADILSYFPNVDFTVPEILSVDTAIDNVLATLNSTIYQVTMGVQGNYVHGDIDTATQLQSDLNALITALNGTP